MRKSMLHWQRSHKAIPGTVVILGLVPGSFFDWKKWKPKLLEPLLPVAALDPRTPHGSLDSAIAGIHDQRLPRTISAPKTYDDLESLTRLVFRTTLDSLEETTDPRC